MLRVVFGKIRIICIDDVMKDTIHNTLNTLEEIRLKMEQVMSANALQSGAKKEVTTLPTLLEQAVKQNKTIAMQSLIKELAITAAKISHYADLLPACREVPETFRLS